MSLVNKNSYDFVGMAELIEKMSVVNSSAKYSEANS